MWVFNYFLEKSSPEISFKFIPGFIITLDILEFLCLSKISTKKEFSRIMKKKKIVALDTINFS